MPNTKSALKELRKSQRKYKSNVSVKSELRTLERKLQKLTASKDKPGAENLYRLLASKLDKAAANNIIHKNTASRKKSRLMKAFRKIS